MPLVHHFDHFLFWFSTKTILTKMRVRLTYLFDFRLENHASQAMSTENFPFWVQENGPVLENEIVFEKIVNLSKNFQKLFLQTVNAQPSTELTLEMRNLGSEAMEHCPLPEGHSMATESCPWFGWRLMATESCPLCG